MPATELPEIGLYTRTSAEAELYMQLHPCECGEDEFRADLAVLRVNETRAIRYEGDCVACGLHRDFCFRYPDGGLVAAEGSRYGPPEEPSQLVDAAEWLLVAGHLTEAAQTILTADDPSNNEVRTGCDLFAAAADATSECLKFVPPDSDTVPEDAVWSEVGQLFRAQEPDRFGRSRLVAEIERQKELAEAVDRQFHR